VQARKTNPHMRTQTASTPSAASIDAVFRALADATRRNVVERLGHKPISVSDLAARYPMALPSFVEHMKVLEKSGLVRSRKIGRVRTYELVPNRLKLAEGWLEKQRRFWEQRLDQLDAYLLSTKGGD
jgi:DNA-binding transcriptional ArsR family regulator